MENLKQKIGRQGLEIARQENKIRNLKFEQTKLKKRIENLEQALREWVNWSRGNPFHRPFEDLLKWTCQNVKGWDDKA